MKYPRLAAFVAVVLLLAGIAAGWFLQSTPKQSDYVDLPVATVPAVAQPAPQTASPQPATVQPDTAQPAIQGDTAASASVVAPVTDPVAELPDHDEQAVRPSAETINAIREIRKPVAGEGQVTQLPDGSSQLNLGNSARSVPVATIGKDGKVHVEYHGEKYVQEPDPEVKNSEVQKQETKNTETQQP